MTLKLSYLIVHNPLVNACDNMYLNRLLTFVYNGLSVLYKGLSISLPCLSVCFRKIESFYPCRSIRSSLMPRLLSFLAICTWWTFKKRENFKNKLNIIKLGLNFKYQSKKIKISKFTNIQYQVILSKHAFQKKNKSKCVDLLK